MPVFSVVTGSAAEKLPDLRPPHGEIPPGFWEQRGGTILLVAAFVAITWMAALLWWRRRPKIIIVIPPAEMARKALDALRNHPQDAALVGEVSQVVRRYVLAVLPHAAEEPTTEELSRLVSADARIASELTKAVVNFLRECDVQKFAPHVEPQAGVVSRALELVGQFEVQLRPSKPA